MISGTIVITDQGLSAESKADQDKNGDHVDFHYDPHSRHALIAIGKEEAVHESDAKTLHEIRNGGRETNRHNLTDFSGRDVKADWTNRQFPTFSQ